MDDSFGTATVNPQRPGLVRLTLRRPDGSLEPQSLLSDPQWPWLRGAMSWGHGACTYVVDAEGTRFESRHAPAASISRTGDQLELKDVTLRANASDDPVATEDWVLRPEGDALVWKITRTWLKPLSVRLEGSPALFMSMRGLADDPTPNVPNGVVTTLWVQPDQIAGRYDSIYRPNAWPDVYRLTRNNVQWLKTPDQWAIHKIFGNWDNAVDIRIDPVGGHLYRRGFFGWLTETGVALQTGDNAARKPGDVEEVTIKIQPVDKRKTGYQLAVEIPDEKLQNRLTSFYTSLINGGLVNDQVNYNFGNETDGWYYGGGVVMQGLAIGAGVPADGEISHAPFDLAGAFRRHLAAIMGTAGPDGRGIFGYNWTGDTLDDNVHATIGTYFYYLHTGDLPFVKQHLPILERMLDIYITRRNADGLFDMGAKGHQYYDAVPISGVSGYHNAFFYKALLSMAELQHEAGDKQKSAYYEKIAEEVKRGYNKVLWAEDAPGGPRYLDWITHTGEKVDYCSDASQFPALAFGIASPEQATKLLATIDRRIEELRESHDYGDMASLSAYWPQPPHLQFADHTFPIYMNGGGFFAQTYWEIVARAWNGDVSGALLRLQKFAEGSEKWNWVGNNWVQIHGEIGFGGADEPYLSDVVAVPAALVNGLLGFRPSVHELKVEPALPATWKDASVEVMYKGEPHLIAIKDGKSTVTALQKPALTRPTELTWRVSSRGPTAWGLSVDRYFDSGAGWTASETIATGDGGGLRLRREIPPGSVVGLWDFRAASGTQVPDKGAFNLPATLTSGSLQHQAGENSESTGIEMKGVTSVTVTEDPGIEFRNGRSFTLTSRFKTTSTGTGVIAARNGIFCLMVKNGRVGAWLRSGDGQVAEAIGSSIVNDGEWHEATAVFDFEKKEVSILLDGKLDSADGSSFENPVSFASLGEFAAPQPLTLGSLLGTFFFDGTLESVSFRDGLPSDKVTEAAGFPPDGTYVSIPFNWNQPVRPTKLQIDLELNGGKVEAQLETSSDAFVTVQEEIPLPLQEGSQEVALDPEDASTHVRLRLKLMSSADRTATPRVSAFVISGETK